MNNPVAITFPRQAKIVIELETEPGFRRNAEICSEAQRRIGGDGTNAVYDCADAVGGNVQIARQLVDAEAKRLHKVFEENFSRMDRIE